MLLGLSPVVKEQTNLYGRVKIDLLVGDRVAIEIKALGSFGDDAVKYEKISSQSRRKGMGLSVFDQK